MMTKEGIAVTGDFPIALWDDIPARETGCWGTLREQAAEIAAGKNATLADETGHRTVLYMRLVDGAEGEPMLVETTREQAEFVKLRLALWAQLPAAT